MTVTGSGENVGGMIGLLDYNNGTYAADIDIEDETGDAVAVQSTVTVKGTYNVDSITAGSGATYVGPIVGRKCSGLSATNVYYETATSANGSGVGTKMTELSYVSLNADVKANWVYSREYDRIELYYFHDLLNNHSSLPVYRWEVSGGNICYYCESINCPKILSQVPASGISAVIYVKSDGYTQANADPAALGSKSYPCKTLEIANECVERNKLAGAAATKIVIMDTITVPSDYRLPAATSGTMILTANDGTTAYSGVLSFTNPSKYDGARHFHIDGATLIENITIKNDSISGVYFYAENRSLTMGDGITMTSTNPYYVEDYYGKTAEGVNIYTYAGARVHVIGGYSINDWMH